MVSYEQIILLKDYSDSSVKNEWERTKTGGRKTKYKATMLNKNKDYWGLNLDSDSGRGER